MALTFRNWLLTLFQALAEELPANRDGIRHSICLKQYGSEEHGFEDRLACVVRLEDDEGAFNWRVLWLEDSDFEKSPIELAREIKELVLHPSPRESTTT